MTAAGAELTISFDRLGATPVVQVARTRPDREWLRRLAADDLGLPTAPFWFIGSSAELTAIAEHAGFPLVLSATGEPAVLLRAEDIEPAWARTAPVDGGRALVETVVEIDHEITMLTVRAEDGALTFCEPIGHRRLDGVLEVWQPQPLSQIAVDAARSIAARVVGALGGRGMFGVELLVRGDEVYFADAAPGLPDTGLVTLRSQRLSMFDLHARAWLGLPMDPIMVSPAAAEVVPRNAGGADGSLSAALNVPESDVRVFPGLGLALATGPDVTTARDRVRQMSAALKNWWL